MAHDYLFRRRMFWISLGGFTLALFALVLPPGLSTRARAQAEFLEVGSRGFPFGTAYAPTTAETQSKLWFNDNIWWGSLFNPTTEQFEIHRYDPAGQTWHTTGILIDQRKVTRADCLWDGEHLYITSAVRLGSIITNKSIRIMRYSYDSNTRQYLLDEGFPVILDAQATYGVVLDKDTTGAVWVAYTAENVSGGSDVYVAHSNASGTLWTAPTTLPAAGASGLMREDIAALVAFNGQIGVMWSNQNQHAMFFATHVDGAPDDQWQVSSPLQGTLLSDNHIQLKTFQTGAGDRVFAAVKTSLNDQASANPDDPLLVLLEYHPDGSWSQRTFGRVAERHTRPLILIDEERQALFMFATSFCCGSGKIYYKQLNLKDDQAQFPEGMGDTFLDFGVGLDVNNATSTKQTVTSRTGALVLAEDGSNYVYNRVGLIPDSPPVAGPPSEEVTIRIMIPFIVKNSLLAP